MSTSVSSSSPLGFTGETALRKEQRLFSELFSRLIDAFLNRIFDLRPAKATRRRRYLLIIFLVSGFLVSLRFYPLNLWAQYIQDIFLYLLNPAYAASYIGNPFANFFAFIYQAFTDPRIFQYLPVFLAPFFIALQAAAIYLADIFELERASVARRFIWEVALSGSDEIIRISQGDIAEAHRESPNYLIGGPGKVVVDLDSVALFEKPDGTPHIIGPTGKEPGGKATLDGFERFRQAIDIRDQYVDLRDQDPKSESVKSRSRDGIPITATDVRLMFSIYRGGVKPSSESPYPFSREAIEKIIYKATSRVTPELANPSTYEFSWINNMIGLIRGELSRFMNEHNLTEYLASTGLPEFEKAKQREAAIVEEVHKLTPSEQDFLASKELKRPPEFQARYKISNLFAQFAEEFTRKAQGSGVELHWIGVGTWKTPIERVPEKHLEAWKLSQENLKKDSKGAMRKVEEEAIIHKLETLIESVPLKVYDEIISSAKHAKKTPKKPETKHPTVEETDKDKILSDEELDEVSAEGLSKFLISRILNENTGTGSVFEFTDADYKHAIQTLLLEYRKQLIEAVEFMKANNEAVPPNIEEAVKHIDSQLGFHWAGKT